MPNYDSYSKDRTKKTCFSCKKVLEVTLFRVREKKLGRGKGKYINNTCRLCEKIQTEKYRTMTFKGLATEIVRRKKYECKKYSLEFDLSVDWVLMRLNQINFKCELTGLPMRTVKLSMDEKYSGFQLDSISIDRIDCKGGYVKSNIRFVLNQVNIFRQNGSDEQMYKVAKALLEYKNEI